MAVPKIKSADVRHYRQMHGCNMQHAVLMLKQTRKQKVLRQLHIATDRAVYVGQLKPIIHDLLSLIEES